MKDVLQLSTDSVVFLRRRRGSWSFQLVIHALEDELHLSREAVEKELNEGSFYKRVDGELREVLLGKKHEWNGQLIRDLDISRQTLIVLVRRQGTMLVPHGDLILKSGDEVLLYQKPRKSVSVVS